MVAIHQDHALRAHHPAKLAEVTSKGSTDAYGVELGETGTPDQSIFWYQGQAWYRHEIGSDVVYVSPTRIYDPLDGRFLERDLIPRVGEESYGYRSPNNVDATGLITFTIDANPEIESGTPQAKLALRGEFLASIRDIDPGLNRAQRDAEIDRIMTVAGLTRVRVRVDNVASRTRTVNICQCECLVDDFSVNVGSWIAFWHPVSKFFPPAYSHELDHARVIQRAAKEVQSGLTSAMKSESNRRVHLWRTKCTPARKAECVWLAGQWARRLQKIIYKIVFDASAANHGVSPSWHLFGRDDRLLTAEEHVSYSLLLMGKHSDIYSNPRRFYGAREYQRRLSFYPVNDLRAYWDELYNRVRTPTIWSQGLLLGRLADTEQTAISAFMGLLPPPFARGDHR